MAPAPGPPPGSVLDIYVEAYESARAEGPAVLSDFLPPRDDPGFLSVLAELIRVELEYTRGTGAGRSLQDYCNDYPELFSDRARLGEVAFEEYRLRRLAGEAVSAADYAKRYGVDVSGWPLDSEPTRAQPVAPVAQGAVRPGPAPAFPEVGQRFLDFELVAELGRGAFGRVYLAHQHTLAGRLVALKVSLDAVRESQTLARLQHTNVMPVYSVHHAPPFHAVCMPYYPSVTLAGLSQQMAKGETQPDTAIGLMETIRDSVQRDDARLASTEFTCDYKALWAPLGRRSSVEAVLWIGARLAEGLAHAHERGIVHRDLKPANILLTQEGQPLILDFNLSDDSGRPAGERAFLGGTLPYMAPEQLQAFLARKPHTDPRGDVYALGLILYELLARQPAFPTRTGAWESVVSQMIADRQAAPPPLRCGNPAVARGVAAIVAKCLEPDPANRYPDARPLSDDLQRQFDHRPLRHTPEPLRERAAKFLRRNPRLLSSTRVGVVAGLLLVLLAVSAVMMRLRLNVVEARSEFQAFRADARPLFLTAHRPEAGADRLERHIGEVTALLGRYDVLGRPDWHAASSVRRLPPPERAELRNEVGDLLFFLVRDKQQKHQQLADPAQREALLNEALGLNYRAQNDYAPGAAPRALWHQRVVLCRLLLDADLGDESAWGCLWRRPHVIPDALAHAGEITREAHDGEHVPLRTARDHVLEALSEQRAADPVALLEQAERLAGADPDRWYQIGCIYRDLARADRALVCFNTSLSLRPEQYWVLGGRGELFLDAGELGRALADLDRALEMKPDWDHALVNRALAAERMGRPTAAERDLSAAIERRPDDLDLLRRRSRVRALAGDAAGAQRDRAAVLAAAPATPDDWIARSLAQPTPAKRLADLDAALTLTPYHPRALQHRASVLSEQLGRPREAIAALDLLLEHTPGYAEAWGGRAVLRARLGQRDGAITDARRSLQLARKPLLVYQAAGTFALLGERREALQLLREAFRRDPSLLREVPTDPDLAPLRQDAEFIALVDAARRVFQD